MDGLSAKELAAIAEYWQHAYKTDVMDFDAVDDRNQAVADIPALLVRHAGAMVWGFRVMAKMRVCKDCGEEFPETRDYFYYRGQGKKGNHWWSGRCKWCRDKRYAEKKKAWQSENLDKVRAMQRRYYHNHRDEFAKREFTPADRERKRRYYEKNRDYFLERAAQWRKEHPEQVKAMKAKQRAMRREAEGEHTAEDILTIYDSQKGLCWWCGKPVGNTYDVDHRIAIAAGGTNNPENLCITCPSCNRSKQDKMPWEFNGRLL